LVPAAVYHRGDDKLRADASSVKLILYARRGVAAAVLFLAGATIAGGDPAAQQVTTVAGTGASGIDDGPAASATFLMPMGLARAADGTLYVSDEAAQRIRVIAGGIVRTLAGSGALAANGLSVAGGYRDGPALQAQFNRPTGIALGPDSAVYVADSNNACVRKIKDGSVSTVAGKCGERGTNDGPVADARLKDPRALAFDAAGNLYIADFDWGLRKLDIAGMLTTVHFKSIGDRRIWGVTVGGPPSDQVLVATTPSWVIDAHLARDVDEVLNTETGAEAGLPFGTAGQIAALDARRFVFTDLRTSTVRYLRLPAPKFATTDFTRVIAGGRLERSIDNAGYADGTFADSRFYAPSGIALGGHLAYVADTGNRRIRRVELPGFAVPESGLADVAPYDAGHYQIALIGPSWVYWDSLDRDSICGLMETALDAAHTFSKPARCHSIRIDAATFPQVEEYLDNYLPASANLVVLHVTTAELYTIFPDKRPPAPDETARAFKERVAALQRKLGSHVKLMLFWTYQAFDVSDVEDLLEVENEPSRRRLPVEVADDYFKYAKAMMAAVAELGIPSCDSYPGFLAYEKAPVPGPLYGTNDSHLNRRGSDLAAGILSTCIEQTKP
jgi:sugar lactone lactonase YvrE